MDIKNSFLGGCLVTLGITSKNPRPSTNAARVPLFLRTTLPKTRIEADGTESLCSSSSLMHSRYERERKEREREREREREKACISKQRSAIGEALVGRLPV